MHGYVCIFTGLCIDVGQHSMVPHPPNGSTAPKLLWWWVALAPSSISSTLPSTGSTNARQVLLALYDGAEPEMRNKHIQMQICAHIHIYHILYIYI